MVKADERKIQQLDSYIKECEKQIIKYTSDNLQMKMNNERIEEEISVMKKDYENKISLL